MKKKITTVAWLFILIAVFCSACGNTDNAADTSQDSTTESTELESPEDKKTAETEPKAKEENLYGEKTLDEIKEDLGNGDFIIEFGSDDGIYISNIELIKRNTTEKTDDIYCTISVNMDECVVVQSYQLIYNHYTTGGWILDEYIATSEQSYLPLTGVHEYRVASDVSANFGSDCDFEIIEQSTNLESLSDNVKAYISMDGNLFKASGTVIFNYAYYDGWWNLIDYEKESDYAEYYDFTGTWMCDYRGDGSSVRLFLVKTQDDESLTGDYIQMRIIPSMNEISLIEEFEDKPFTVKDDGSVFWDSQGYTVFYYDKNTVMETDNTPFVKYSDSYMTVDEYISENYPEYSVRE